MNIHPESHFRVRPCSALRFVITFPDTVTFEPHSTAARLDGHLPVSDGEEKKRRGGRGLCLRPFDLLKTLEIPSFFNVQMKVYLSLNIRIESLEIIPWDPLSLTARALRPHDPFSPRWHNDHRQSRGQG